MQSESKIYVAGHRGLVGSAIMRRLKAGGYLNIITRTHAELDLIDQIAVTDFLAQENPDYVFLAAAKVGGILANNTYPADFIYQNLMIQSNIIHAAFLSKIKKLLFLGSSCIYPKFAPQPMNEDHLLTGILEPTNEPYAIAKIAGIKMCSSYNRQYGTNFISVMPTNLYGPGDNYDLQNSHVMPAMIRKMHEAKIRGDTKVCVWGSGSPRREFLYNEDMADACVFLMENRDANEIGEFVNIGVGEDLTIRELAEKVSRVVGYHGELVFDTSKPDGTPQKLLDVKRLNKLGWRSKTILDEGIKLAYQDFIKGQCV
ncbi:GDP-L-fucose synthase [Sulfurirhabdus autotrophica]|nr:GDP-L-fucose synthase [Sulfurirhabdus autotrophica]